MLNGGERVKMAGVQLSSAVHFIVWAALLTTSLVSQALCSEQCSTILLGDHSTLDPVSEVNSSVTIYQIFKTNGSASDLNITWTRRPASLSASKHRPIIVNELLDATTINCSITLTDIQLFPDIGLYNVTASNNCTTNHNQFYLDMLPCDVNIPPIPLREKNQTVIADSDLPDFLHLQVIFHGSNAPGYSYTSWGYAGVVICIDSSNISDITCNTTKMGRCIFTADLWIPRTSEYCKPGLFQVNGSLTSGGENSATVYLYMVPPPSVENCVEKQTTLITIHEHIQFECTISNYSEFVTVSVFENERVPYNYSTNETCWRHSPDSSVASCPVDFPSKKISGTSSYQLCVGYNNSVQRGSSQLQCSESVEVRYYTKILIVVCVVIGFLLLLIFLLVLCCVCFRKKIKKCWQKMETGTNQEREPFLNETCNFGDDDDVIEKDRPSKGAGKYGTAFQKRPTSEIHPALNIENGPPVPRGITFDGSLLPKVTVIYPHNPKAYTAIVPPEHLTTEAQDDIIVEHENNREQVISTHRDLVQLFVKFLQRNGISVAYDRLLDDAAVQNKIVWMEEQIKDSDYVILIITDTFISLLNSSPDTTPDEELFFQSHYLSNLIHQPEKNNFGENVKFVCVFLDSYLQKDLIPKALQNGNSYELWSPFEHDQGESKTNFLSLIMKNMKRTTRHTK